MSNSKFIVITANTSWYLFNFRANLIKRLLIDGYRVTAIAPHDDYSVKLTALGCEFIDIRIDQGGTNPIKDLLTATAFYLIYRRVRPDVVLNFTPKNNIYSTLAASMLKIRAINNIAGLGSVFIEEGIVAQIAKVLYSISQKRASKIFFQNEEDRALFQRAGIAPQVPRARLPGSGVDLQRFSFTPPPDSGYVRFILIGRILYEKGVANYVAAAAQLRRLYPLTEFRLLGFIDKNNPSAIPASVVHAWHNAGDIVYLGSSDNVEEELKKIDCVVLPSYYREGVPRSLLEGAATGRPLITTNNIGCRDAVREGINGYLCEPNCTDSLKDAMEKIIKMNRDQRLKMGINSRALAEELFDEAIIINSYCSEIKGN